MNTRLLAARIIDQVGDGHSLAECLPPVLQSLRDVRDKAFVQALVYGVCRYYFRLDVVVSWLIEKPMKAKDSDVHGLLLVGLYQLMEMRVPPHAAVAETVNAAGELQKPWARGFVNAILRSYLRQQESLTADLANDEEAHYSHPAWWISATENAWPNDWEKILFANNMHPPFALRVNKLKQTREQYKALLPEDSQASDIAFTDTGLIIEPPIPVESLPEFYQGAISVQDGAAQFAAPLLELAPGQHVLDACAAPGGKLTHILETVSNLVSCVAVEKDSIRLISIKDNLTRLKLQADCIVADAADAASWWNNKPFDRILLDAPCSGSGVVRRHPDIKILRQPLDIPALAKEQLRLLSALWPLLAPGGILLYVTCSIFPEENVQVVKRFIEQHTDAQESVIHEKWGVACELGRQILPGMDEMDGFYYARLVKR